MSVHIAVAQFSPRKGDYRRNLNRLGEHFAQIDALTPRPQVYCLPESALTGYFLEGGVREVAVTAGQLARDLDTVYRASVPGGRLLDVAVGFYEEWQNKLYNSALYVTLGGGEPVVRHVHRKIFLPTYGLFDEERFVERGLEVRAFDTSWGRAAVLVCEDAWHSLTGTIAALDRAQVIFLLAAPPARGPWAQDNGGPRGTVPASVNRWERLARDIAEEHGVHVVLASLAGSEGGKMFSGASMVMGPKGDLRIRGPLWEEAILTATLDPDDVTRARADMPLVADLEVMIPHLTANIGRIERGQPAKLEYDGAECVHGHGGAAGILDAAPKRGRAAKKESEAPAGAVKVVSTGPFVPPVPLDIDPKLTEDWLVHFIRHEMAQRGFNRAVIGVSGGVDSAVTAYLAARALGAGNVIGVRMPYRTSSKESSHHGQVVIDALGIESRTIDISDAVDGYLKCDPEAEPGRRGNVMARMRMIVLFDLSAKHRAIPLGTGNKTERLFGYFTWHADDAPPINPLGDLFKTQVWELARHLGVPDEIVSKPPTADLVVGQTDEGDFGISYAKADELLNWMLAGYKPDELIARGFNADEVHLVRKRLESTHWKRRLPTVAMLTNTAIGESYLRPVDY
ncbi:MAG TPA: NAD+ synthase [Gemmatimonadaceae bacterium]|nr:NAD+ synthase [Gemmatimonadaceae bacterium]